MNALPTILMLLACAIFLWAFWIYNKGVIFGHHTPAFTGWALFSIITFVNFRTYLDWTGEWINIVVFFTDFFICSATTLMILIRLKGKVRVDRGDIQIASVSLFAIVLWVIFQKAQIGNLINLVAYSLAFVPIYRNVLKDPRNEPTKPWATWAFAFLINIVVLKIQSVTTIMDYVSPIVYFIHHAAIGVLSLRKSKEMRV
ncbi:MAG: hypothetical protein SGJ02_00375 [bacterium]|nr:hypothetical protein [bacterium]